jgi:hypothetical protein
MAAAKDLGPEESVGFFFSVPNGGDVCHGAEDVQVCQNLQSVMPPNEGWQASKPEFLGRTTGCIPRRNSLGNRGRFILNYRTLPCS